MRSPMAVASTLFAGVLVTGACGSGLETYSCEPACPPNSICGASGCVSEAAPPDLSGQAPPDLRQCQPACGGALPYCNASYQCVACLTDSTCPSGQICQTSGQFATCVPGCRDSGGCNNGGANPERRCCGGECIDTSNDAANCGGCGTVCSIPQATATCSAGICAQGACSPGWGDCNADPSDGCESNLTIDPARCGACGRACDLANAIAGCSTGCYIAACRFGWDDCDGDVGNGCETSVLRDPRNCGACGHSCPSAPHARSGCDSANCELTSCDNGFADCDGLAASGCEVNVYSDVRNCGGCGQTCGLGLVCRNGGCTCPQCNFANASSSCVNNVCALGPCNPGFANCDGDPKNGCEADLINDASSCGACGLTCPMGSPVCVMGACSSCLQSLSNIGGNDFTIAFSVQSLANAVSTVVGQRGVCNRGMMWDVRMNGGPLGFEFDDNVNYAAVSTKAKVNDNNVHDVIARRVSGTVTVTVDGNQDSMVKAPAVFGVLTPLYIGKGGACEGKDGTVAMVGTVSNVCLSSP